MLSGARDRDWTGGLFLTKEVLCLWATWASTVILTVYNRLIKKTEKDKLFEHLLCIRNQKDDVYVKMEPATGFEPVTCWLQISCSTNWATPASFLFLERETGLEPATYSLEGCRSTNWAIPALQSLIKILEPGGERRIRTFEGRANGFTVRPLWPLGNLA